MLSRAATADRYFLMDFCWCVKFWYAWSVKADCLNHLSHSVNVARKE